MCLDGRGRMSVEVRSSHGSFVVHPSYGYNGDSHTPDSDDFGKQWREDPHPEFLIEDLDDLITALQDAKKYIKSQR
jgi:hypothetical protein